MPLYVAEFPGTWLGGYAIVWAETPEQARQKAYRLIKGEAPWLRRLSADDITVKAVPAGTDAHLIWDGDY